MELPVKRTVVIKNHFGPDKVRMQFDFPGPECEDLVVEFTCPRDTSLEYLRNHFDTEPTIIEP